MLETNTAQPPIDEVLPAAEEVAAAPRPVNSVDATAGQPIVDRVMARKQELEGLLTSLPEDDARARGDIDLALSTITELLTGDLEHVPAVVAADMSRWLERNKHVAESAVTRIDDVVTARVATDEPTLPGPVPGVD